MKAKYKIGSTVYAVDGRVGNLIKVAVDPHSKRVTDLIVEKGWLLKTSRVIPATAVADVSGDQIHLSISSQEISESCPQYRPSEFAPLDPDSARQAGYYPDATVTWALRYGATLAGIKPIFPQRYERAQSEISNSRPIIGRNTKVRNATGSIGRVDHLLVNEEDGAITHLLVRQGLWPSRIIIPMSFVERIDGDGIYVALADTELQSLEKHTPRADRDILHEVQERLRTATEWEFGSVKASLADGWVKLSGSVPTALHKWQAQQIVEKIRGVLGVENELSVDDEVKVNVINALLSAPDTFEADIEIEVQDRVVTLQGEVTSDAARRTAAAIAAAQPGVQDVRNYLTVAG